MYIPVSTKLVVAVVSIDNGEVSCGELAVETEIVSTEDVSVVLSETLVTVSVSKDVVVTLWDTDKVVDASVSLTTSVTIKKIKFIIEIFLGE